MTALADKYWPHVTNPRLLRRAAHLVDKDSWADFQDLHVDRQVFAYARDSVIDELCAALAAERYMPEPCVPVAIPKSPHSQRPGAILPYRDRVLIQAITMCLAPKLDQHLSSSVWSWRVKRGLRGKAPDQLSRRGIFRETDITDLPFLKRRTVTRYLEPFDPWYALWPRFDRITRRALADDEYKFMVVSDISGYFENIQLSLLHSLLGRYEPEAPNTINLLMQHFSSWSGIAQDGSRIERGIPQGNSVSSFYGNFFLKPVDDFYLPRQQAGEVRYFRYVDDIRILAKTEKSARAAALALEEQIRRLKLNLQSAKTSVLPTEAALRLIADRRLDELEGCRKAIKRGESGPNILRRLAKVAADPGDSEGAIRLRHSRPPLSSLNLRVMRVWSGLHLSMGSSTPVMRMCREAIVNPNYRTTRDIRKIASAFPRSLAVPKQLWNAVLNDDLQFPYQEAELIRALRGFSHVPEGVFEYLAEVAQSCDTDPYLRLQAIVFLCRFPGVRGDAQTIIESCQTSPDARVITGSILAVSLGERASIRSHVREISRHASPYANRLIQFIKGLRNERAARRPFIKFVFENDEALESRLYEQIPFLRFIATGPENSAMDLLKIISKSLRNTRVSKPAREVLLFLAASCARSLSSKSRPMSLVA